MKYTKKYSDFPPGNTPKLVPMRTDLKYNTTKMDCENFVTNIFTLSSIYHWKLSHHYTTSSPEKR